jgi:hypothetical protein
MRQLTNAITTLDTDKQYVSSGRYQLVLDNDGAIDMDRSFYRYVVTNLPSGSYTPYSITASEMPAAFRSKLKEIHAMVVNHAENNGLLHPGTDTDDL